MGVPMGMGGGAQGMGMQQMGMGMGMQPMQGMPMGMVSQGVHSLLISDLIQIDLSLSGKVNQLY